MNILKKVISCFWVFLLSISAILLTLSFLIKWNLNEKRITSYIKENDLSFILKTKEGSTNDLLKDTTSYLKKIGIPDSAIDEVVNSEPTHEFVGIYMYKILRYLIYKKGSIEITKKDILNLVEKNFPIMESCLQKEGKTFTEEQEFEILALIEVYSKEIMELFPTVNTLIRKIDQESFILYDNVTLKDITDILEKFTSKNLIYSLILLIIACTSILLFLHFKQKISLLYIRAAILFYSFFFIFIEILMGTIIKDYLMSGWESANSILNYFVNAISKNLWIFILTGLVLSIFITVSLKYIKEHSVEKEILKCNYSGC